jgi:GMC oxidoreductase
MTDDLQTVLLQSSDPTAAPLIDPKFPTHPYDKRVIIHGMRETMRLLSAPVYASNTIQKLFPKDNSDKTIWEYVRQNCLALGTCQAQLVWEQTALLPALTRIFEYLAWKDSELLI